MSYDARYVTTSCDVIKAYVINVIGSVSDYLFSQGHFEDNEIVWDMLKYLWTQTSDVQT